MNDEIENLNKPKSKNWLWMVLIILILICLTAGGWYLFFKKSAEGEVCTSSSKCDTGLSCANKVCSSGQTSSSCAAKTDCKTGFCVDNKCTEGKKGDSCSAKTDCKTSYCVSKKCTDGIVGDVCTTYNDCISGLYCKVGACATPPDFSQYFSKVVISKMKPGMPPGPNNPLTATTSFKTTDAIEIDFSGVKPTTVGAYYYEMVNPITGEAENTTKGKMDTSFNGKDSGSGTDFGGMGAGTYDLNIYYLDKLVYTTQITLVE